MRIPIHTARALLPTVLAIGLAGCGGGESGPPLHSLSGAATFDGQPIPAGRISFTPDAAASNEGPGSGAAIADGRYETPSDAGIVSGPHVIVVEGYDGVPVESSEGGTDERGTPLFPAYEMRADLPEGGGTLDIEVPASAAN